MITTRITIKPHLAEYCIGKWGADFKEPVRFPRQSELYIALNNLTLKRPVGCAFDTGNLEVILPNRKTDEELDIRKNPEVYNYISERGCKIIERKIEIHFWAELHEFMDENRHRYGITYTESVYTFRARYRIESISEDAMLKNYQRWKENRRRREKRGYKRTVNL